MACWSRPKHHESRVWEAMRRYWPSAGATWTTGWRSWPGGSPASCAGVTPRRRSRSKASCSSSSPGAARERELRLTGTLPRWLADARSYLHDPGQVGSLSELATAVGVHPVTLARGFRKAYGCSVGAYLRWLRVARAAHELTETDAPLAEIALAAGFADQSHFSNVFRREMGLSPSAFRRAVRAR